MFTGNIFVCLFSMTILNYKERLYQICRSRTTVRSLGSIALAHVFAVLVLLYYICIRVCSLGSIVWHSLTCSYTVVSVLFHSYICLKSRFNCIRSRVLVSVLLHSHVYSLGSIAFAHVFEVYSILQLSHMSLQSSSGLCKVLYM